jgi:hypothetical protein
VKEQENGEKNVRFLSLAEDGGTSPGTRGHIDFVIEIT